MKNMTKQEFIASIRRNSSGFSRGASINRGVTRHHQHGRWQARMVELQEIRISTLGHFVDLNASAPAPHINSSNRSPSGSPSSGNKSFDPLMIIVPGLFFIIIALLLFYFRAIRKTQAKKNKVEEDRNGNTTAPAA